MTDPALSPRDYLQALPDMPAPPGLAGSILRAQRGRVLRLRVGAAAGAVALACLALLPQLAQDTTPEAAVTPLSVAARPPGAAELQADLRALDRTLQAAYEAGASEDDVAPLWTARARLLDAYQGAHQI